MTTKQVLLRQALLDSGDGGARTVTHLWLALVSVFVARWSNDLFVIFFTLKSFCTLLIIINRSVELLQKKSILF
jgi:hypothetical protein